MHLLTYLCFRVVVASITYLPFPIIYKIADGLSWLLYRVIGYRKKVVLQNLHRSFPSKTKTEIAVIAQGFYQNFADILLESFKAFSLSGDELVRRYKVMNPEVVDEHFNNSQNILVLGSHYCNWEWGVMCVPLQCKHQQIGLYKPIANPYINNYVARSRSQFGMQLASIKQTNSTFEAQKKLASTAAIIMIADQSPSNSRAAYWLNFLNQDTACLHGPEKYARQTDWPVFYFETQRVARGVYQMYLRPLITKASNVSDGTVTQTYMQYLEKCIQQKPQNWLWSHRRWKKKRNKLAEKQLVL